MHQVIQTTGRVPDAVFDGHVHNYQRFTRTLRGRAIPYIVAGAGGYWNLHAMQKVNGATITTPYQVPNEEALRWKVFAPIGMATCSWKSIRTRSRASTSLYRACTNRGALRLNNLIRSRSI